MRKKYETSKQRQQKMGNKISMSLAGLKQQVGDESVIRRGIKTWKEGNVVTRRISQRHINARVWSPTENKSFNVAIILNMAETGVLECACANPWCKKRWKQSSEKLRFCKHVVAVLRACVRTN